MSKCAKSNRRVAAKLTGERVTLETANERPYKLSAAHARVFNDTRVTPSRGKVTRKEPKCVGQTFISSSAFFSFWSKLGVKRLKTKQLPPLRKASRDKHGVSLNKPVQSWVFNRSTFKTTITLYSHTLNKRLRLYIKERERPFWDNILDGWYHVMINTNNKASLELMKHLSETIHDNDILPVASGRETKLTDTKFCWTNSSYI